jgi:hypothetical protein
MDLVETCDFGVNDSGTCEKIDTPLTQNRSLVVPDFELPPLPFDLTAARSFVYRERRVVGAHTALGRRFSNFGEQMENFVKAKTWDHAERMAANLIKTYEEIKSMTRVLVAAPTLALPKGELA